MIEDMKPWQFKPGQSGNPSGRRKVTPAEKELREIFIESLASLRKKSMREVREIADDEEQTVPNVLAAKSVLLAVDKDNSAMFAELFNRTIGKVKDELEIISTEEEMTKEELIAAAEEEIRKLKNNE